MRTVFLRITGKVQGVFYRATAQEMAEELGLRGWVRNCPDGAVEALAAGPAEKIDSFIAWCRRGPEKAVVENVAVSESAEPVTEPGFKVRRQR
ncbi:acylphosphatase [Flaviaesturariibacter aridisoli]|uniref:acylphosphatase n=1 Tax=Flaviaesturariibacter aridisoli TaxID=2545761 RepID=A0A4R4DQH9_9BACT|nr:acylphosphatase [Flaviaesturariibacter aridisoli]TCZ64180.1 acylphosphatase [Flaviaesturariibacter aridisoli]